MKFLAVPTYRQGTRLGRSALRAAKPIVGLLIIEDRRADDSERYVRRVARFRHTAARFPELLLPLFEPVLLRCSRRGILLGGFEIQSRPGGRAARTLQAWWLRPVL